MGLILPRILHFNSFSGIMAGMKPIVGWAFAKGITSNRQRNAAYASYSNLTFVPGYEMRHNYLPTRSIYYDA